MDLIKLFLAALKPALPRHCLAGHWPRPPLGRLVILALGKAAGSMAAEALRHYGDSLEGLVIVPEELAAGLDLPGTVAVMAGSHPVPDQRSVQAADAALQLAAALGPDDLLLALVSGGGSALMCKPAPGISLAQKQQKLRELFASGAPIAVINQARIESSAIKGGRLATTCRAPVRTLVISDVPGDDPALVASGPTIAAGTQAMADIVATGATQLNAAQDLMESRGFQVVNLGDRIEGEAGDVARDHAEMARRFSGQAQPVCILSGGETTVTTGPEPGLGGRNTEYLLALALALDGLPGVRAIACDSDGRDGQGEQAGAVVGPDTLKSAIELGIDPADYLARHDSATFFEHLGCLVDTGPTGTNVNDFRAIIIEP